MRKYLIMALLSVVTLSLKAQEVGLSFSYFIPRNGYFSTPISPFSLRGVGFDINNFLAIETGASLYRMSGLNVTGLPFETKEPLVGPNFTIFVPLELVIQFAGKQAEFDIKGGAFAFYGFDQKINYGNMDRAIREYENWDVANANFTYSNKPGYGFHAGAELTLYVTRQFGISLETNYLMGGSRFPLNGSYTGGTANSINTIDIDYADALIDFTGLEFSIGVILTGR